jgi:hypothetical protein
MVAFLEMEAGPALAALAIAPPPARATVGVKTIIDSVK